MGIIMGIIIIILAIVFGIALIRWLIGIALNLVFFTILNLGFLPAGLHIAKDISPVGVYVIPYIGALIEVPLHYFLTLWINIIDFICWIPSKIPGLNFLLEFIKKCPDKDLTTHGVDPLIGMLGLTGHRNFITHSVLNPYIFLILLIGTILYFVLGFVNKKIQEVLGICIAMCLFIHSAHLFADCMPGQWIGGALIKSAFIGTWNAFFSKAWLLIQGILSIRIGFCYCKIDEKSETA